MRLPGFYNHKYARRHFISVLALSREVYGPDRFPIGADERTVNGNGARRASAPPGRLSQSERDWADAKRALARGDAEDSIVTAIAERCADKPKPSVLRRTHGQESIGITPHRKRALRIFRPRPPSE
jgi:hypothetical protein